MADWCKIHEVEQGSADWHDLRRGKITGFRANKLFAQNKNGSFKLSRSHTVSLIAMELMRGEKAPSGRGKPMERGHEYEADAVLAYEFETMQETSVVGFMTVNDHPNEGASPDRLVGDKGVLEIKVPTAIEKHVDYLRNNSHVEEYFGQLRHTLYVTGRDWIEIVSYYPEAAPSLQLARKRLTRADLGMADYPEMLTEAWAEIHARRDDLAKIQSKALEIA